MNSCLISFYFIIIFSYSFYLKKKKFLECDLGEAQRMPSIRCSHVLRASRLLRTCAADGPPDSLANRPANSWSTSSRHRDILVITLNCRQHERDGLSWHLFVDCLGGQ